MTLRTLALLAALGAVLGACRPTGTTHDPTDGGPGGEAAADDGPPAATGPFDLHMKVSLVLPSGEPGSNLLFVAVRDLETRELVAFVAEDQRVVSTIEISKPAVLVAGHRYAVGIKDTWYASCLDASANVWYREIPPVTGNVDLTTAVTVGVDEDPRGCDVLHEPVGLEPGTYATTAPVLGIAGNRVALVVSQSGRLYTDELRVFCGTTSSCVSTTVGFGDCELEEALYPGATTFALGSEAASHTTVTGTATLDRASQTIRYVGRVYTWTGSSTICCDESFDVTLTRVGAAASACP
jgi:hypothetical protein